MSKVRNHHSVLVFFFAGSNEGVLLADTGDGPAYGIGLMADLEKNFFIRGDFTLYDIEGAESEAVMLGAGLRF